MFGIITLELRGTELFTTARPPLQNRERSTKLSDRNSEESVNIYKRTPPSPVQVCPARPSFHYYYYYCVCVQENRPKDLMAHYKHYPETFMPKTPPRKVLPIWGIQANMLRMQQSVCGPNRTQLRGKVQRTRIRVQNQQPLIQLC